ncbi:MAG: alpha/beta hydrolase [Methylococcales bacterium]|nr:alpha/beta hydrolase [Methylococcales bacterium]
MNTSFVTSPDGYRIAYDVSGNGSTIVLLHGGGHTRQNWHDVGYVNYLKRNFKVITIDIRGNGESDKPTDMASYSTTKHCEDILAVVNACNIESFTICGFSYGGNIGRYLAAQSSRVAKFIMIGIPFGLGASGKFRQFIINFQNHWSPIVQALSNGTLDSKSLSMEDQDSLQNDNILLGLAWLSAILDWKSIEPKDLLCPTLWLVGSKNETALTSVEEYRTVLDVTKVRIQVVEGLNHEQEFTEIDKVVPFISSFVQA